MILDFKNIHIVAIGGVSMSAMAEYMYNQGINITGSDKERTPITEKLENLGIKIYYSHKKENISEITQVVIRNSAIKDDNPEILQARNLGIPVIERANAWGEIMKDYENVICFAGTHGKTTTTSMMSHIAIKSNLDATIMVGTNLDILNNSTLKIGSKKYFIAEACEYCNAFLNFNPTIAVILNIEADHLDFFKDESDVCNSFKQYALKVPEKNGIVVANFDDDNIVSICQDIDRKIISFGEKDNCTIQAKNITINKGYYNFDVYADGKIYCKINLCVIGKHNMLNALATLSVAYSLNIDGNHAQKGLASFTGASRRFEKKGVFHGAMIVDDYAHHPSEITATLLAAKQMGFSRIICAFQSHTYTRTHALYNEFISALKLADKVILTEIYSAREENTSGVNCQDMAKLITNAEYFKTFDNVQKRLEELARPDDLIITMGAGELYKVADSIVSKGI